MRSTPSAQQGFRTRCRFLLYVGAVLLIPITSYAQSNTAAQAGDGLESLKTYAAQAIKVVSFISVALGLIKAIAEWTKTGRTGRSIDKALRLSKFLELAGAQTDSAQSNERMMKLATTELQNVMQIIYPAAKPIGKWRRILLVYVPKGWRAFIAHILFFSMTLLALVAISGTIKETLDKNFDWSEVYAVAAFIFMSLGAQRWAALEARISAKILLRPTLLPFGMKLFPSNSIPGLIAKIWLISDAFALCLSIFFTVLGIDIFSYPELMPRWQTLIAWFIGSFSLPISYLWTGAEYQLSILESKPPSLWATKTFKSLTPIRIVGFASLAACLFWLCLLPFSYQRIHIVPPNAMTTGMEIGMTIARLLPVYAIYRCLLSDYFESDL